MKSIITKILLPLIAIVLWLAVCIPIATRPDGFNYFLFWIIAGIPFGIRWMFFKLMPKGYGISGTVGAFAFSVIAGGLIGGIMLMIAVITVFANMVKMCLGKTRR
ncbi:MAG: ABC transporter permease [Lachnospiraceae bacterium]|nr:ABC transporter permease [Lachnospiraceae bacterium]